MRDWWSARRTKEDASGGVRRGSIALLGDEGEGEVRL